MRQEVTPSLKNCIATRRGDVDKEKHQMGDATLMYYQILCNNIKRDIWKLLRRIRTLLRKLSHTCCCMGD